MRREYALEPTEPPADVPSPEPELAGPRLSLPLLVCAAGWLGLTAALCTWLIPGWDFFLSALLVPLVIVPLSALYQRPLVGVLLGTSLGEVVLGLVARAPIELESPLIGDSGPWLTSLTYALAGLGIGLAVGLMSGLVLRDLGVEPTRWDPVLAEQPELPDSIE